MNSVNGIEIDSTPIVEFVKNGEKIKAIQYVMSNTGASLGDAKAVVEIEAKKIEPITPLVPPPLTLSAPNKSQSVPFMSSKTIELEFKYNNRYLDYLLRIGVFAVIFVIPLIAIVMNFERYYSMISSVLDGDFLPAMARMFGFLVCFVVWLSLSVFIAIRVPAVLVERSGAAVFGETAVELFFTKKNVRIEYDVIEKIGYEKTVGGSSGIFTPSGKLVIQMTCGKKVKILSSRNEAEKKLREYKIEAKQKYKQGIFTPLPDVLLWEVCSELSGRTGLTIDKKDNYIDNGN